MSDTVAHLDVQQLASIIKNKLGKVLIVDCRSFLEFNTAHVINSVNVCCSKIVKRRLQQDKVCVRDFMTNTCHIELDETADVIVYDQNSSELSAVPADTFLSVLLNKLLSVFKSVNLLKGGFIEFNAAFPALCEDKTNKGVPLTSLSQPCLPISNLGPTKILPFLYLGSQHDAMNKELLKDHNITYELNVSSACPKPEFIPESHFLRIPVNDNYSEKLLPHFSKAFHFVDKVREANGCVLVHCLAGISRSPTVAIAYVMRYLRMMSDDAYRYVKSKRVTISPNFNFLGQLLEFEKQLKIERILNCRSEAWSAPTMGHAPHFQHSKRPCFNDMRSPGALYHCLTDGELDKENCEILDCCMSAGAKQKTRNLTLNLLKPSLETVEQSPENSPPVLDVESHTGDQSPTSAFSKLNFGSESPKIECTSPEYNLKAASMQKLLLAASETDNKENMINFTAKEKLHSTLNTLDVFQHNRTIAEYLKTRSELREGDVTFDVKETSHTEETLSGTTHHYFSSRMVERKSMSLKARGQSLTSLLQEDHLNFGVSQDDTTSFGFGGIPYRLHQNPLSTLSEQQKRNVISNASSFEMSAKVTPISVEKFPYGPSIFDPVERHTLDDNFDRNSLYARSDSISTSGFGSEDLGEISEAEMSTTDVPGFFDTCSTTDSLLSDDVSVSSNDIIDNPTGSLLRSKASSFCLGPVLNISSMDDSEARHAWCDESTGTEDIRIRRLDESDREVMRLRSQLEPPTRGGHDSAYNSVASSAGDEDEREDRRPPPLLPSPVSPSESVFYEDVPDSPQGYNPDINPWSESSQNTVKRGSSLSRKQGLNFSWSSGAPPTAPIGGENYNGFNFFKTGSESRRHWASDYPPTAPVGGKHNDGFKFPQSARLRLNTSQKQRDWSLDAPPTAPVGGENKDGFDWTSNVPPTAPIGGENDGGFNFSRLTPLVQSPSKSRSQRTARLSVRIEKEILEHSENSERKNIFSDSGKSGSGSRESALFFASEIASTKDTERCSLISRCPGVSSRGDPTAPIKTKQIKSRWNDSKRKSEDLDVTRIVNIEISHPKIDQKSEGLYRAQSCPGIVGSFNGTAPSVAAFIAPRVESLSQRLRKSTATERADKIRNRFSCGNIDHDDIFLTGNFVSCPDFSRYANGNGTRGDAKSPGIRASISVSHQPYTSIIQVS